MPDTKLSAVEYCNIRNAIMQITESPEREKVLVLTPEDGYQQYPDKGIPLLQNIDKHWLGADLEGKQQIVGSIFPEGIVRNG